MYARVTTTQIHPTRLEEARRLFRETMAPAIHRHDGSKGLLYLADSATGKVMMVTFWDSEAEMNAVEANRDFLRTIEHLARLMAAPPTFETFGMVSLQF